MPSRFIHTVILGRVPYPKAEGCLSTCGMGMYQYLLYPLSVDGNLGSFHTLALVNNDAVNMRVACVSLVIILSGKCPGVRLLGHTATLSLVFSRHLYTIPTDCPETQHNACQATEQTLLRSTFIHKALGLAVDADAASPGRRKS